MAESGEPAGAPAGGIAAAQLRSLIERIERLEQEKTETAGAIRDVYAEAKGHGFDARTMRTIVQLRKMESADRQEREALLDLYRAALGV